MAIAQATQGSTCKAFGVPQTPIFHGDYSFNTGRIKTITTTDYVVFVITLALWTMIGFYVTWHNWNKLGITEYLLAGRTMGPIPVGCSLFTGFISAASLMGVPAEMYNFTTMYIYQGVSYLMVAGIASAIYMPVFYQLKVTCIYEYLEMRFTRNIRMIASAFFIVKMLIYLGVVQAVPGIVLNQVTGLDMTVTMLLVVLVGMVYTAVGGMKAVIWTDFFQAIMMIGGVVGMVAWLNFSLLSWGDVLHSAKRTNRLLFDDFQFSLNRRSSFWSFLFGGIGIWAGLYSSNQVMLHRCLTCRSLKGAKRALLIGASLMCVNMLVLSAFGLFMAAFYENCDPIRARIVGKSNQLVPLFVMDTMSAMPGLPGLFLTIMACATLSTISSGLSSTATAVLEDFIRTNYTTRIKDVYARRVSQVVCVVFSAMCFEMSHAMLSVDDGLRVAARFVVGLGSPVMGVFSVGMVFPWVNHWGGLCGLLSSFSFNLFIIALQTVHPVQQIHEGPIRCLSNCNVTIFGNSTTLTTPKQSELTTLENKYGTIMAVLFTLSDQWVALITAFICILVSLIVSHITGNLDSTSVDPRLIVPVADVLFPFYYLPENIRENLRFGLDHTDKWLRTEKLLKSVGKHSSSTKKKQIKSRPSRSQPRDSIRDRLRDPTQDLPQDLPRDLSQENAIKTNISSTSL